MKRLLTLAAPQRAALVQRYKAEKNVRLRDRLHCVLLKADGRTNREVASLLLTSQQTVNDWLNRYDAGGLDALCAWEVGGSDPHLTQEQAERLQAELDTHGFQSARRNWTRTASRAPGRSAPLLRHSGASLTPNAACALC
jgi:hypothetical protein